MNVSYPHDNRVCGVSNSKFRIPAPFRGTSSSGDTNSALLMSQTLSGGIPFKPAVPVTNVLKKCKGKSYKLGKNIVQLVNMINFSSSIFHLGHPRVTVVHQSDWDLFALGLNSSQLTLEVKPLSQTMECVHLKPECRSTFHTNSTVRSRTSYFQTLSGKSPNRNHNALKLPRLQVF
jgi:hypothetical protein